MKTVGTWLGLLGFTALVLTGTATRIEKRAADPDVERIIAYLKEGAGQGGAYDLLTYIADTFGHRLTGTVALENAIDYMAQQLTGENFTNVHTEEFTTPNWKRGLNDRATLIRPRSKSMNILSLGNSISTPQAGITAEAIVVKSFEELEERATEAAGKIVVYNQPWVNYGTTVQYRTEGAWRASKVGAVAALVRSVTPFSIDSPHTGGQTYSPDYDDIPVACITIEDAEYLQRSQDRGHTIEIMLELDCGTDGEATTRNLIAEIPGSEFPDEVVLFGGHIDSWDVGTGAMDDLGGVVITWQAMRTIQQLGLSPKRTIRAVFWSAEEIGVFGGDDYYEKHKDEADKISMVMESDSGTFEPRGIGFTGNDAARSIVEEAMSELSEFGPDGVGSSGGQADTGMWNEKSGVPMANLWSYNEDYFIYHHSLSDMPTVEHPDVLDNCTVVWATAAYMVANLDELLPRDQPASDGATRLSSSPAYCTALLATLAASLLARKISRH